MAQAATAPLTQNVLRDGLILPRTPDPAAMVIFGASGDLTARKLMPALYNLALNRYLPSGFSVKISSWIRTMSSGSWMIGRPSQVKL